MLGARDQRNAQYGALFAGLLKITPVFLMGLPGAIAYIILRDQIGGDTSKTLPVLITELMPAGLKGLMAAALMSTMRPSTASARSWRRTLWGIFARGLQMPRRCGSDVSARSC